MAPLTRRSASSPKPAARRDAPTRRAKKASRRSLLLRRLFWASVSVSSRIVVFFSRLSDGDGGSQSFIASAKSPAARAAPPRVPRASSFSPASVRHRLARARLPAAVQCAATFAKKEEEHASDAASVRRALGGNPRIFLRQFRVSSSARDSRRDATARFAGRRAASVSMLSAASRTRALANARD